MDHFRTLVLGVVLLALTACAQVPKQAFNREAAPHVKSLVIALPPNQASYETVIIAHPGANFGLIGGIVAAVDMQQKSARLTDTIDPAETRLQDRFASRVATSLAGVGYETGTLTLPAAIKEAEVLAHVKQNGGQADAALIIRIRGAYWAAGPTTDYQPLLSAKVSLYDLVTGNLLYQEVLTYGYTEGKGKTVHFAADPKYRFLNMDALTADPELARNGLLDGLDALAAQIADDLKRN